VKDAVSPQDEHPTLTRDRGVIPDEADDGEGAENVPSRAGYADFFARVSHDLRSPLGIVMHVMQRLEADLGKQFSDEQRVLMRLGSRGVRRLQTFVERVALLSELENDEIEVNVQPVDLGQAVQRMVETSPLQEARSEVKISYEPPGQPCMVAADQVLLSRILSELLSNAVVHARRAVRVGVLPDPNGASVFVEDDGPGVADNARETLYRRFVVRDARGGLGIGLSMVRELVRAQSGDIRLDASTLPPGRPGTVGARFVLSLPHVTVTQAPAHG
jgi:two-component system sensor histidine kinase RstB